MSSITTKRVSSGFALAVAATFALTACSGAGTTAETTEEPMETTAPMEAEEPMEMDPAAMLVGPGCADYAEAVPDGAGSVEGMALDPVATAASNNPLLTTLTAAVSGQLNPEVDLVDTLNGGEFTVFAPVDDAFAAIDPDQHPDVPRRPRPDLARRHRRHPRHRAGRRGRGDRLR